MTIDDLVQQIEKTEHLIVVYHDANEVVAVLKIKSIGTRGSQTHRWRKPDSNVRYRGKCRRSGRSRCLVRADFPDAGNQEETK